jgi:hypothetical protein
MLSAKPYYEQIGKQELLTNPHKYSWNTALYYIQFTQDELLRIKAYLPIPELVLYQRAITRDYLRTHFAIQIDECMEISWSTIERHVAH